MERRVPERRQALVFFTMPIATTLGLCACAVLAPSSDRSVAERGTSGPELCVVLPGQRRPTREALLVVSDLVRRHGAQLAVTLVWPDPDAPRRCGAARQPGVQWRYDTPAWADERLATADSAVALRAGDPIGVWRLDGEGAVWCEEFEGDARYVADDLCANGEIGAHWQAHASAVRSAELARRAVGVLEEARRELVARPEYLAKVVVAAIEREPRLALDSDVVAVAEDVYRRAPRCEAAQHAAFVVRVGAGDRGGALRVGFEWLESVKGRAGRARALLTALPVAGIDVGFDELAAVAFEIAARAAPGDVAILRGQFEHSLLVMNDVFTANRVGRDLIDAFADDVQELNSFAWCLLTREPFAHRCDALALAAARRMVSRPDGRTYWRLDTLALACFRNGEIGEAIRVQREAVRESDSSASERYRARLEDYLAAGAALGPASSR